MTVASAAETSNARDLRRFARIPSKLVELRRWCVWKFDIDENGKPTKVPYQPNGRKAASTRPAEWSTYEAVLNAYAEGGWEGIGFFLGDGFAGLDLDNSLNDNRELKSWARQYADRVQTYGEVSQSGNGVKFICEAPGDAPKGLKERLRGGEPGEAIEVYFKERFFALTGNHFEPWPRLVNDCNDDIRAIHAELVAMREQRREQKNKHRSREIIVTKSGNDDELVERAKRASNGAEFAALWAGSTAAHGEDDSAADLALANHLAFWCAGDKQQMDRLFRRSGLMRDKWDRSAGDRTYGERTLDLALDGTNEHYDPHRNGNGEASAAKRDLSVKASDKSEPALVGPIVECFADIEPREAEWAWRQRFPRGGIALVAGRGGGGKGHFTYDIAGHMTTGTTWPDGAPCERRSVLFISGEDHKHCVARQRLDAAGADVGKCYLMKSIRMIDKNGEERELAFTLDDFKMMEQTASQIPDLGAIIVDPIGSFIGGEVDAYRDNEVRAVLQPIALLAERLNVAVILVAHLRKSFSSTADDLVLGSRAFTALSRVVWHITKDPDDKDRRLLLSGKNNLAKEASGLAFRLVGEPIAHVEWETVPVAMSADDFMAANADANKPGPEPEARKAAEEWLIEQVFKMAGPVRRVKDIEAEAKAAKISMRTLSRAKDKLGIKSKRDSFGGDWHWHCPQELLGEDATSSPELGNLATWRDRPETCPSSDSTTGSPHRCQDAKLHAGAREGGAA